jgi:hypothetical protein
VPRLRKSLDSVIHRLDDVLKTSSGRNALLALVVAAIAFVTLRAGDGGSSSTFCILCGERGLSDFLANVILFAPLGVALALGKRKFWQAVLLGFLFSIFIETAQWRLVSGRDASIGDLVSNTTGAVVGWLLMYWRPWRIRTRTVARAYATLAITLLLLMGALSMFAPNYFRSIYWLHWTPDYESLEQYRGTVLHTRVGSAEWDRQQRLNSPDSVARLLVAEPFQARFIAGPAPATLAPIVSISDEVQEEVILIGADGHDMVYRFRARANDLRLDHANLRVPRVFENVQPGDTVDLAVAFNAKGYCIGLGGLKENVECGRGFTAGQTWSLLFSPNWPTATYQLLGILWLAIIFLPAGFAVGRRGLLIGVTGITTLTLLIAPRLLGFSATPVWEIAGALFGLSAGYALARLSFFKS